MFIISEGKGKKVVTFVSSFGTSNRIIRNLIACVASTVICLRILTLDICLVGSKTECSKDFPQKISDTEIFSEANDDAAHIMAAVEKAVRTIASCGCRYGLNQFGNKRDNLRKQRV